MKNPLSVLIVDDDPITRQLLRAILRESDYDVVGEASNGDGALAQCLALHPDIVLLDISMPGMNGLDILQELRKKHPDCVVVMLSATATAQRVGDALRLGARGFIVKPFTAGKVVNELGKSLSF